jgi:hypothetical protein
MMSYKASKRISPGKNIKDYDTNQVYLYTKGLL